MRLLRCSDLDKRVLDKLELAYKYQYQQTPNSHSMDFKATISKLEFAKLTRKEIKDFLVEYDGYCNMDDCYTWLYHNGEVFCNLETIETYIVEHENDNFRHYAAENKFIAYLLKTLNEPMNKKTDFYQLMIKYVKFIR